MRRKLQIRFDSSTSQSATQEFWIRFQTMPQMEVPALPSSGTLAQLPNSVSVSDEKLDRGYWGNKVSPWKGKTAVPESFCAQRQRLEYHDFQTLALNLMARGKRGICHKCV